MTQGTWTWLEIRYSNAQMAARSPSIDFVCEARSAVDSTCGVYRRLQASIKSMGTMRDCQESVKLARGCELWLERCSLDEVMNNTTKTDWSSWYQSLLFPEFPGLDVRTLSRGLEKHNSGGFYRQNVSGIVKSSGESE